MKTLLNDLRGFVKSVIRFDGSFGAPADALAKLDTLDEYLTPVAEAEEEDNTLELEVAALKEENQKLKDELSFWVKPAEFEPEELPNTVWCSKCFGLGGFRYNDEEGESCSVCDGTGRRPW